MSYICRIERLANGYEVELFDPEVDKKNRVSKGNHVYRDPMMGYAFKNVKEVLAFLEKNLDKAVRSDEYSSSFGEAIKEMDDD